MYIPKYHRNENPEDLKRFISQNGFAVLISDVDGKPWATHLPLVLSGDGTRIHGHMSRGNQQWKNFNAQKEVLVIFHGPHTYISSSWYNHENVPTWNYIAVHVWGTIRITDGDELLTSLKELVNKYEKDSTKPVTVEGMSEKFLSAELRGIVGFEITIRKMEAAYKLSQNRDEINHRAIVHALEERRDEDSHKIAEAMKKDRLQ